MNSPFVSYDSWTLSSTGHEPILRSTGGNTLEAHFARLAGNPGSSRPQRPYTQIPVVRSCVELRARCLRQLPVRVSIGADQIVEGGPIVDLLRRPNPRMNGAEFFAVSAALWDLTGECHWLYTSFVGAEKRPTEIMPVGKWQMEPRTLSDGTLTGWWFYPVGRSGVRVPIELDELYSILDDSFDENQPHRGVSKLEAAGLATAQLYKADLANEASLDNGVEPGGAFVHPGTPTDKQIGHIRQELEEPQPAPPVAASPKANQAFVALNRRVARN